MITRGMVKDNIQNYSHAPFVCLVDKLLIIGFCTVGLIRSKIETRIVPPTVVPVEFLYRHQLDGVYTQRFEIVQFSSNRFYSTLGGEIAYQKLVYHQLIGRRSNKIGRCPRIAGLAGLQY